MELEEFVRFEDNALEFKRKALGSRGTRVIKTLDEVAQLLYETGVVPSLDDGRKAAPLFDGKTFYYRRDNSSPHIQGEISFGKVKDVNEQIHYLITATSLFNNCYSK